MDYLLENVKEWKDRLVNNSVKSFQDMSLQRWIRIVLIVGAYLLLRPYLVRGAANRQKRMAMQEAEDLGLGGGGEGGNDGVVDANNWRGGRTKAGGGKGLETTTTTNTAVEGGSQAKKKK